MVQSRVQSAHSLPKHGYHGGRKYQIQPSKLSSKDRHSQVDYDITHSSRRAAENCPDLSRALAHHGIPEHHHHKVFDYIVGGFSIAGAIAGVLALMIML